MKRTFLAVLLLIVMLLSAAGCGGGGAGGGSETNAAGNSALDGAASISGSASDNFFEAESPNGTSFDTDNSASSAPQESSTVYQNSGAKLIRTADLNIETTEFDDSIQALNRLVTENRGYFEESTVNSGGYYDVYALRNGVYTVRIPAEKYDSFLSSTGNLGFITSKTEQSQDVGQQYYDLEARLKTQKTKQERLQALLEKAQTMDEIISLESALSDVEYEIECLSTDLNHYDALISYATIHIYLNEVEDITEAVGTRSSLSTRLKAGLVSSCSGLIDGAQDLLIWASYNAILLIVLVVLAIVIIWALRRTSGKSTNARKNRKRPDNPADPTEPADK